MSCRSITLPTSQYVLNLLDCVRGWLGCRAQMNGLASSWLPMPWSRRRNELCVSVCHLLGVIPQVILLIL